MPPKPNKLSFRFFICSLTALILEWPFAYALISDEFIFLQNSFSSTVASHVMAATLMFFAYPKGKAWFHHTRNWAILFFFVVLFLPLFGVFTCLILFFAYNPSQIPELEDDDEVFMPQLLPSQFRYRKENWGKTLGRSIDFIPLADILEGDDPDLKRGAIEKLALIASPESIKAILEHSSDPSPEVRFYVTSSITRIKKSLDDELDAAKEEMKEKPDDIDVRLSLAKSYLKHAHSNLFDDTSSSTFRKDAIFHLDYVIEKAPNLAAYELLLDTYKEANEWEKAVEVTISMAQNNLLTQKEETELMCEYSYQTRRYDLLKKHLKTLVKLKVTDKKWIAAAQWWEIY